MKATISTSDTPEDYHSTKALSNSGISELRKCPAIFKAWQDDTEDKQSPAMLQGSVFHCLALEPEEFTDRYSVKKEDGRTKEGREERKMAEEAGLEQIDLKIYQDCVDMSEAVFNHSQLKKIFKAKNATKEASIYWNEDVNGVFVPCKARVDLIVEIGGLGTVACDLKSTMDASPEAMAKSVYNFGYYRQAAWYLRALNRASFQADMFLIVAVEKTYPFIVTPFVVSQSAIEKGDLECEEAIELYAECKSNKHWPCYTDKILELDLPHWAYR